MAGIASFLLVYLVNFGLLMLAFWGFSTGNGWLGAAVLALYAAEFMARGQSGGGRP